MVGSGQEKVPLAFFALFCRNNAWGVLLERSEGQKFFLSLREPMYKRVQPLRALFGDFDVEESAQVYQAKMIADVAHRNEAIHLVLDMATILSKRKRKAAERPGGLEEEDAYDVEVGEELGERAGEPEIDVQSSAASVESMLEPEAEDEQEEDASSELQLHMDMHIV